MYFSPEQYAMLEALEQGLDSNTISQEQWEILWFLEDKGLARARVDISDGLYKLTQSGEAALSIRKENESLKQAKQQEELNRIISEKANREADRIAEQRFQIKLSLLASLFSAVIGAIVSNLDRIIPAVVDIVRKLIDHLALP